MHQSLLREAPALYTLKLTPSILAQNKMGGWLRIQYCEEEIKMSQFNSTVVDAIARYSALILERATVGCFFVLQEMKLQPRNVQYPIVDLREVRQPALSALEKLDSAKGFQERI